MNREAYVHALLTHYVGLPQAALRRASTADRRLAAQLFDQAVPMATVQAAILLALSRRAARPPELPPLPPIRSLAYFLPVIEELRLDPSADPGYLRFLLARRQRHRIPTDSDER